MEVADTSVTVGDGLCCPLCDYPLRGLAEPRCPECGFAATWAELRAADRNRHPTLFEHGRRPSLARLWWTWSRDGWPWRFWRDVTPANPVNAWRLVLYWAVVGGLTAAVLLAPLPHGLWPEGSRYLQQVSLYNSIGSSWSYGRYPLPSVRQWVAGRCERTWVAVASDPFTPDVVGPPLLVLAWPWLSLAALMVFRISLRQAQVHTGHVLRVAVYGCDFGLLVGVAVLGFVPVAGRRFARSDDGTALAYLALFCGAVAAVRLSVAYGRYLRFHWAVATVLASQVVVVLFVWTCLTLTTDLGGLFR